MVAGLLGNESSDSNRFTLVTPKSENDVRLQATLGNQIPTGLPVGVVSVCISLITVSAFHSDMSEWLTNHFSKEDIHSVENVAFKDIKWGEAPFGYTYTKDDKIKNIYLMHHNQIKLQKPRTYKGVYKKPFSFKYVRYHHDIFMCVTTMIFSCMIFQVM